jgi:protease IV
MDDMKSEPTPTGTPQASAASPATAQWERSVLEKLVMSLVEEKRRARRWSIFFRLLAISLVVGIALLASGVMHGLDKTTVGSKHTALIEVAGVIDAGAEANADSINAALRAAFEDANTAGVVMRINSPGGSPVQAGLVFDEIKRLRGKYPETPLVAVVEEICASGGYYIAAAADKIYVDKASLVGSIGVLMDGFGFTGTMEKLGVERRLLTAGANKGFLDSFSPLSEDQKRFAQSMLSDIHQQFIAVVRTGRGDRLKETPETFSGLIWTGSQAVELGLADATGSLDAIARDVFKADTIVDFTRSENLAERLAKRIGASAGESLARSLRMSGHELKLR